MGSYDFKSLSSYDFEILVRDLLQKELQVTIESFKTGRDGGIDLRYSKDKDKDKGFIVQCKHYASSTYNILFSDLKNKELPKVKKLNPKRYIITTSLGLTPQNKDDIKKLFTPYCISTSDIYGCSDINNLLNKFPETEKQNYKLWLTSSTVMEKILHSEVFNQSEIALDIIKRKSKLYVQNKSYPRALEILNELNYCIISGVPGIGKTTLADILIINYINKGYEVYKIFNDISDAFKVYNSSKKQVFYYDDFLGQTSLQEKLNKNEDQKILDFIEAVHKSKYSKFILTTREYILNQAKSTYGKLATSKFDSKKCVIDLEDYTKIDRAKILFNHIYFSDIPQECKEDILKDKNYMRIINHQNYNPRIINEMTNLMFINDCNNYANEFVKNLDNPERIWKHIFENQLSVASKNLLVLLVSLDRESLLSDVEIAFMQFNTHKAKIFSIPASQDDFKKALKELEGNFISISKYGECLIISFNNPSIRDFLENYIWKNDTELNYLCETTIYFEQIINLYNLKPKGYNNSKRIVLRCKNGFIDGINRNFCSRSVTFYKSKLFDKIEMVINGSVSLPRRLIFILDIISCLGINNKSTFADRLFLEMLNNIASYKCSNSELCLLFAKIYGTEFNKLIEDERRVYIIKEYIFGNMNRLDDFKCIEDFQRYFPKYISDTDIESLRINFIDFYKSDVDNIVDENDPEILEEYISTLENIGEFFSIDLEAEMNVIEERIAELYEPDYEPEYDFDEDYTYESSYSKEESEDNVIDSLFDTLND